MKSTVTRALAAALIACLGAVAAVRGDVFPRHEVAVELHNAAEDIARAWLVNAAASRRIPLDQGDVRIVGEAVATARPAYGYIRIPPPWPETVIEFEAADGSRHVVQLINSGLRIDAEQPYAPSLESLDDGEPGATVEDYMMGPQADRALRDLHRRHLGASAEEERE